jgi:hypothetical protein
LLRVQADLASIKTNILSNQKNQTN